MSTTALATPHLVIAPIVIPAITAAVVLLLERRFPRAVAPLSVLSLLLLGAVVALLLGHADSGAIAPYLLSNWPAPFGIALALDRLAALMLALTVVVALASLLYATAGEARRGAHFHSLFQLQLMGLNGAFLTADLFNLFVFFEVLLAASYALMLHGDGPGQRARVAGTLHALVFNLAGSALFLIAVSLLYGVFGTLNMADLAQRFASVAPQDQRLAVAAVSLLLVVFAVKAALVPLYFWLPQTYASATPAVAALFAVMTKVGVYAIARVETLIIGPVLELPLLPIAAGVTLALAAVGVLAAQRARLLVAYLVVASAGTLLLAVGLQREATLAAALFYLVPSTLVVALLFLLVDRVSAQRGGSDLIRPLPLAGPVGWLGALFFVAAAAVAGMPPLPAFIGKALLLQGAGDGPGAAAVVALLLASSFAVTVAMARCGSSMFWKAPKLGAAPASPANAADGLRMAVCAGLAALLVLCSVAAGPLAAYAQATAAQLHERETYIRAVLAAEPAPPAWDVRREMRERGELK
jgi:multicomponent K+:H+ antiporter subunit D